MGFNHARDMIFLACMYVAQDCFLAANSFHYVYHSDMPMYTLHLQCNAIIKLQSDSDDSQIEQSLILMKQ